MRHDDACEEAGRNERSHACISRLDDSALISMADYRYGNGGACSQAEENGKAQKSTETGLILILCSERHNVPTVR